MQARKFFTLLWRINAIIILLVGLVSVVLLAVAGYMFLNQSRHVDNMANIAFDNVQKTVSELGYFVQIQGSSVLRAPLTIRQTYAVGSGSKEAGSIRNYLYFEPSTRATYWLFPSKAHIILSSDQLPYNQYGENKQAPIVDVYVVVDKDTNGDDRLTESDTKQIAVSAPNGKGYRVLVPKADLLNKATILPSGRLLVLYSTGGKLAAVELNLKDLSSPIAQYDVPMPLK